MRSILYHIIIVAVIGVITSCSRPTMPKPYGYFRISVPTPSYTTCSTPHAHFSVNSTAQLSFPDPQHADFFNIHYPYFNATIHCTYLSIEHNLPSLLNDAQDLVYSHTIKASAIPEQEYIDSTHHTFGMLYQLHGNTATPAQFYLTDSIHHFVRASVYINSIPNQDSLAPVIDYLVADTRILMESLRWQ